MINIGGYTTNFIQDSSVNTAISVLDNFLGKDSYLVVANDGFTSPVVNGFFPSNLQLRLNSAVDGTSPTVIQTDALPLAPYDLAGFVTKEFEMNFSEQYLFGNINSISMVTVPLPATFPLLG